MSSIDFTIPQPAWELIQQLLANLSLVDNDEPKVTLSVTVHPSEIHREPAEVYLWQGRNYHPGCLIHKMVIVGEMSPAARFDMTPAEAIKQRNRANFRIPETDVFHVEPVAGTLACAFCSKPWAEE